MPVGVIKINKETKEVEWFNPYAELIFQQMMVILTLNYWKITQYLVWG